MLLTSAVDRVYCKCRCFVFVKRRMDLFLPFLQQETNRERKEQKGEQSRAERNVCVCVCARVCDEVRKMLAGAFVTHRG